MLVAYQAKGGKNFYEEHKKMPQMRQRLAIKAISSEKNSARQLAGLIEISGNFAGLTLGVRKGQLERLACSECGYAELYIKNPEGIEIDGVIVRKYE